MLNRSCNIVVYFVLLTACVSMRGQANKVEAITPERPTGVYQIDYTFSENQGGKRVNVRTYRTLVRTREKGSIRIGNRVPIAIGMSKESGANEMTYLDVGVNIDCRVEQELDSAVALFTNVEISSLAPEQSGNRSGNPVLRQLRYQLDDIVPVGKETLIASADEVDGTRRLQVEVLATKVR
jgi:hypothetical protein